MMCMDDNLYIKKDMTHIINNRKSFGLNLIEITKNIHINFQNLL